MLVDTSFLSVYVHVGVSIEYVDCKVKYRLLITALDNVICCMFIEGGVIGEMGVCRGCEMGKPLAKTHPSKDVMYRATQKLELVHADLAGPTRQQPWGGARYLFVLADDFSRESWMILLKQMSDVEARLKEWKTEVGSPVDLPFLQ